MDKAVDPSDEGLRFSSFSSTEHLILFFIDLSACVLLMPVHHNESWNEQFLSVPGHFALHFNIIVVNYFFPWSSVVPGSKFKSICKSTYKVIIHISSQFHCLADTLTINAETTFQIQVLLL